MTKMFKNSKQIFAVVMALAILAVSLFAGSIVASADSTEALCAGTRIEYWDGAKDTSLAGAGTQDNPYIITNAAELNYVCNSANAATEDKYYVVDPAIKAFILQPQSLVTALGGDSAFMNITSADQTKALFEGADQSKLMNWLKNGSASVFAGHFDGNGVTIYGMYSDGAAVRSEQCGLFPLLDGNGVGVANQGAAEKATTLKNFAVKNSYVKGYRRVGVISSTAWWNKGGAYVDGWSELYNCEVANNFLVGQDLITKDGTIANAAWGISEMGVIGGAMANDPMKVTGLSVYGNKTEYRVYGSASNTTYSVDTSKDFNRLFAQNTLSGAGFYGELHDAVSIGTLVSQLQHNKDDITYTSNIYTNIKSTVPAVTLVENPFGPEGQAAMKAFDWENDWFMAEQGPTFRSFHGAITLTKTNTSHYYACETCGLKSYGGEVEHNWDDTYKCIDCEWQCTHGSQTVGEFRTGDCVTKDGYYTECHYCTWGSVEYVGEAYGHVLTWVEEILADCEKEGRQGYWHCSECNGNFTADSEEAAKWAPMSTNILDPETTLVTPIAPHNALNREDGSILVVQQGNDGHYWICYTCDGKLLAVESEKYADEGRIKKHKYDDGVCVDCGWECPEHNYQPSGIVHVVGSCTVDREEELKCTNCGDKQYKVTPAGHKIVKYDEVPATDKLEGTKAHYACTECKEIYTDAEGKNKATSASLVIPKVLPPEYQNQIQGNVDTSDKSPATGDSVASVLALAVLAGGAAVAMTRKIKK
ncbi:MAG: hypothetical protein IKT42_01320 [Clostridia bacterium]|nr:hypothetical protein [Clostridia bacterium]